MAVEILESLVPPIHILSGASFSTFTTLQDVSPKPDIKIPANRLLVQTGIELEAFGHFSTTATPTLILGFYMGTPASIAIAVSSAITTASGAALFPWWMQWKGRVRAIGTAGQVVGQGSLKLGTALTTSTETPIPITAALRTVAIDTSIEKIVGVCAAWSASSASNLVVVNQFECRLTM